MIFVDVAPDHPAQPWIARLVRSLAKWVADARAERRKRLALQDLLFAPEHRLRDMGIRREELVHALDRHRW